MDSGVYQRTFATHSPAIACWDPCWALQWRHNDHDGVSNHQPYGCLLKRLYMRWSKKTSKLRVTGLCEGNSPGPVNSPHKGPVTRKKFSFDDVIMDLTPYWIPIIMATSWHGNASPITGFCDGNPPVTGRVPSQKKSVMRVFDVS